MYKSVKILHSFAVHTTAYKPCVWKKIINCKITLFILIDSQNISDENEHFNNKID